MPNTTHKVKKGEKIQVIAKRYKVKDWKSIWHADQNKKLRKLRKKPESLEVGDVLTIPDSATAPGNSEKPVNAYKIKHKGKTIYVAKEEYETLVTQVIKALKLGVLFRLKADLETAKDLHKFFNDLNDDQWIVSKIVSWTSPIGNIPDLPSPVVVGLAESTVAEVDKAIKSKNLDAIQAALKQAEVRVNAYLKGLVEYRNSVISSGKGVVKVLSYTRTAGFISLGVLATGWFAPVAPSLLQASLAAGGGGLVTGWGTSIVDDLGRRMAGEKVGFGEFTWNSIKRGITQGAIGTVTGPLSKAINDKVVSQVLRGSTAAATSRLSVAAAANIDRLLKGGHQKDLKVAIFKALKVSKGKETNEQFADLVTRELDRMGVIKKLQEQVIKED